MDGGKVWGLGVAGRFGREGAEGWECDLSDSGFLERKAWGRGVL